MTEQLVPYLVFYGYPTIAVSVAVLVYWYSREKHTTSGSESLYLWGWVPALVDSIILGIFWPIWIVYSLSITLLLIVKAIFFTIKN